MVTAVAYMIHVVTALYLHVRAYQQSCQTVAWFPTLYFALEMIKTKFLKRIFLQCFLLQQLIIHTEVLAVRGLLTSWDMQLNEVV